MPRVERSIRIENVVASASINQRVDLNAVVKGYPGVEYRPVQFPGLVFRLKRPKTATLIFSSGKMVCTGAKSAKEAKKAHNDWVLIMGKKVLAYAYYLKGENKPAIRYLSEFLRESRKVKATVYLYPYLMELCLAMKNGDLLLRV